MASALKPAIYLCTQRQCAKNFRRLPQGLGARRTFNKPQVSRLSWTRCQAAVDDANSSELDTCPDELCKSINLPRRSAGKKRKVLFLAAVAAAEYFATSAIIWSPLVAVIIFIIFTPSEGELRSQDMDLVERAKKMAVLEYWRKMAVTPKESVEWLNRVLQGLWSGFVQQFLVVNSLNLWQEKIADLSPDKWAIQIKDFELGATAPTISDVQVLDDITNSGQPAAMDMVFSFDSGTLSVNVEGSGPLGSYVASISGVKMTGAVRILPVFEHRMLLYAFKQPPSLDLKLSVSGPAIGEMDIPQFDFLKRSIRMAISDLMVDPNRGCLSLDYEPIGRRAVDVQCNVEIISIAGASVPDKVSTPGLTFSKSRVAAICFEVSNIGTKVTRTTQAVSLQDGKAYFGEKLSFNLGDMAGLVEFKVRAVGENGKIMNTKPLGTLKVNIAHMGDGTTGFWSIDKDWRPVACRWKDKQPWAVTLPVQGIQGAEVKMKLSVGNWSYMQPFAPLLYRASGERTVIMQVVEARNLVAKDMNGTSDPYVKLNYDSRSYGSRTVYKTLDPVWGDMFVFSENSSLVSRRVRGEVWDKDFTSFDDREGFFFIDLDLATEGILTDRWFQLSGEASGEVRIRFTVLPGVLGSQTVNEYVRKLKNEPLKASVPTVTVTVFGAKRLISMDPNGKSDPYCEIRYGDQKQMTPVREATVNPNWNFQAKFPYDPNVSGVEVVCLDKDVIQFQKEVLGSVNLDLKELVPDEEGTWKDWLPLLGKDGSKGRGEIDIRLELTPRDEKFDSRDVAPLVKRGPGREEKGEAANWRNGSKGSSNGEQGLGQAELAQNLDQLAKVAEKQVKNLIDTVQSFWND